MAKKMDKTNASTKVTARDVWNKKIGQFIANDLDTDVERLKEGILISTDEGDVIVKVILKKDEIEYGDDDVLETYNPTAVDSE